MECNNLIFFSKFNLWSMYNALLWQQILQNIIFELDCKKMLMIFHHEIYNKLEYDDSTIIMIDSRDIMIDSRDILMRPNNIKVIFIIRQVNDSNVLKIESVIESIKILRH